MDATSNDITFNISQDTSDQSNYFIAKNDILQSFASFNLWHYLAINEIRRRYRRTVLGPFWTSLSVGIFIGTMGFMLSVVWKSDINTFLPYFCSGYICWAMLSTIVVEGCGTFITNASFLRQLSIPYVIYACLITWRNFIVFCHHFIIFALVMIYCHQPINLNILFAIPGFAIIFISSVSICLLLGMICARFRDFKQIIESSLQLVMFVTPIMWQPQQLGRKGILITKFNPIFHYISLIRLPMLGQMPPLSTWIASLICTAILVSITFILFSKKYRNIIFWL